MIIGKYYWVRYKSGADHSWQPGKLQITNGMLWFGLCYTMTHFSANDFEIGDEIIYTLYGRPLTTY